MKRNLLKTSAIAGLLMALFFGNAFSIKSQTIEIDSLFTADGEIYPFEPGDTIYGLSISGTVHLFSDTSLVRVILSDSSGNEWMVYEAYPMINPNKTISFNEFADETMFRQIINPANLRIEILQASFYLDYIELRDQNVDNLSGMQDLHNEIIEASKVDSINTVIEMSNMLWFASSTSISELAYYEKLLLFGDKYNLKGLEYYSGGIYDDIPGVTGDRDNSILIDNFDWRNRHGANDPSKNDYYYDGDPDGSGWLTDIKNQSDGACNGLCYIYGPLAAIEGVSNLYFNQHVNYNLSEQHVLDCDNYYDGADQECDGGGAATTNSFVKTHGVLDGICYPRDDTH